MKKVSIKAKKMYELRLYGKHYKWCSSLNECKKIVASYYEQNKFTDMSSIFDDWDAVESYAFIPSK